MRRGGQLAGIEQSSAEQASQERSLGEWAEDVVMLYHQHFEGLVQAAQRFVRSRHVAEELTQEAFIKFAGCDGVPRPGRQVAYLRSIVLNNARMHLRRSDCEQRHRLNERYTTVQPDDECVRFEVQSDVAAALAELPERQRDVIVLRYLEGHSEAEVASHLGITAGSVKTHCFRGRERLRSTLAAVAA